MQTKMIYMNVPVLPMLQRVSLRAALFLSLVCAASAFGQTGGKPLAPTPTSLALQQANDRTVAFKDWINRYVSASGTPQRSQVGAEGIALAKQRRAAMLELIKTDPAAAYSFAIAPHLRAQLPPVVADEVESYVSGIGDLSVMIFCPGPKNPTVQPMQRKVTLNGKTYDAHVFGRRATQLSKTGIPLSGVVLDGVMALDESPIRELAADEPPVAPIDAKGYVSARAAGTTSQPIVAEIGGKQYRFSSRQHLEQAKLALEAAEAGIGPVPKQTAADIVGTGVGPANAGNPPTAWTTGLKKILVIRVDFSDIPGDPTFSYSGITDTAAYCQTLIDSNVAPFYVTSSYGLTSLTNTVTTQLYRMPQTAQTYATSGDNDQLHADARALAAADYTLSDYDRICVVFSFLGDLPGSFITYGGLAQLGGPYLWVNGEFDFRVVSHELGHTYGLYHSGLYQVDDGNPISTTGSVIEYGNDYDTMGANFADDHNCDFNPFYKNQLGWISDFQVQSVSTNPATYRVYASDWSNTAGATNAQILGLKIVKDSMRTYWVGVLRNFTNNNFAQNGIYTIWAYNSPGGGGGGGFQSALLDMNTPGLDETDAALQIGATFNDPAIKIAIRPAAKGGTDPNGYVDIDINGGSSQPQTRILVVTNIVTGGNGNGTLDPNECNDFYLTLTNASSVSATGVRLTLSSSTPGVFVIQPTMDIPVFPAGAVVSNVGPFRVSTIPEFVCGTSPTFTLGVKSDQGVNTDQYSISTGAVGTPVRFDSLVPVPIPDLSTATSPITVSNLNGAIGKVTVGLYLTHTFVSDLTLRLISPDNVTNILAANVGGSGDNFGASCISDALRTVFDDAGAVAITSGAAPFVGNYRPQFPLSVYNGKYGTNANGTWKLEVSDDVGIDVGAIQCWSLYISPAECVDGGGSCPGTDLSLTMVDTPDPVVIGSNLVYTLNVTNLGPNAAKGTILSQNLPGSVVFVSATTTLGTVSQNAGVVTANLGNMPFGSTATVTVTVIPAVVGSISSSATVTSLEPEINPPNNTVTEITVVQNPTADLAVSFSAAPNPAIVGGTLTYTATAINNGPSTATGVTVTNTLPATVLVTGATSSQGSVTINSNTVIYHAGSVAKAATATVTITTVPLAAGTIFANARIVGNLGDPNPANNSMTISTVVGLAADLGITITDSPDPVVVNSNFTYTVTVTNRGPNPATSVIVNQTLAPSLSIVGTNLSQGGVVIGGGTAVWTIGNVPVGGVATMMLTARSGVVGTINSSVSVNGAQADANLGDNTAETSTLIATPFVSIVAAGANLKTESITPANGAIDVGETVTIDLRLRNAGNIPNTNLVATLLATGGVTSPSGAQTYGVLSPGGLPVAKSFTFTASGTNGGTLTATLQISDGGNTLSNVTYMFTFPKQYNFTNGAAITIPSVGSASPYPSTIAVSNVSGTVGQVTATLNNLNHTYAPDVDVLLVGPLGQKVVLMGSAGGASGVANANVTFNDSAAQAIPQSSQIVSGSYKPANYTASLAFPSPAPAGPYAGSLSAFANLAANGTWSLYIVDHSTGDAGNVASGWSLSINVITPVNNIADLGVAGIATPSAGLVGDSSTWTITVTNSGPNIANGVVVTNTLTPGLMLQSVTTSQGVTTGGGSVFVSSLGTFATNGTATIAIVAKAISPGAGSVTTTVAASDIDLNSANNTAVIGVTNAQPVADLAIGLVASPSPAVTGSNVTFTLSITNKGPLKALATYVPLSMSGNATYQSVNISKGVYYPSSNLVGFLFGDLVSNETATATVVVTPQAAQQLTNLALAFTESNDTIPGNNQALAIATVVDPHATIVASSAAMIAENLTPNAAIDAGETVTIAFTLANIGQLPTENLNATLLATGGVISPSGSQNYGSVVPGLSVSRNFTFTAPNTPGGTITATLQLDDNGTPLPAVAFVFGLPRSTNFANPATIVIPDHGIASLYPSTITVSGLTGVVGKVTVALNGFTHGFPSDVDALLVGPQGQKLMVMSDAGGGISVSNLNFTFDDNASSGLPASTVLSSGTFNATDIEPGDLMPAPAPAGEPSTQLSAFNGTDPNGNWSLYVVDDSNGDAGSIAAGWALNFSIIQPVSPVANVGIVEATCTPSSILTGEIATHTIVITNRGPSAATNVVVTDSLPLNAAFSSAGCSQGTYAYSAGVVTFNVGTMAAGSAAQFTVSARLVTTGSAFSFIAVGSSQTDLDSSDNNASIATQVAVGVAAYLEGSYDHDAQTFDINLTGQPLATYILERSTDLRTWNPISTNVASGGGVIKFQDNASTAITQRFYRAVRQDIP